MNGDLYSAYTLEPAGYCLWAGTGNRIAMARKHRSKAVYAVTATVQRYSNVKNSSALSANATIRIPNTTIDLVVEARRQGSTYVLDDTMPGKPRCVQLDGFHEAMHPWFWSQHSVIEGELFSGFSQGGQLDAAIATELSEGKDQYSFVGSTSHVSLPCQRQRDASAHNRQFEHSFEAPPTHAGAGRYVWVRARRARAPQPHQPANIVMHTHHHSSGSPVVLSAGADGWGWRRVDGLVRPSDTKQAGTSFVIALECQSQGGAATAIEVDRLVFTAEANFTPP